jgi:thiamine-phosphate pyrophosphorylase
MPRLYLDCDAESAPHLPAALARLPVAAVRLDAGAQGLIARLRAPVQDKGCALVLADGEASALRATGCDGVELGFASLRACREARAALGENFILGIRCGDSRHAAMEAGEAGADYVAFSSAPLVSWWCGIMEIPAVASGVDTPQLAAEMAAAGADFLCLSPRLWTDPSAAETLAALE